MTPAESSAIRAMAETALAGQAASRKGAHVMPGRVVATKNDKGFARGNGRNKAFSAADAGSGTTLLACKNLGNPVVGIEIEERYCALAVDRLRQGVLFEPGADEHTYDVRRCVEDCMEDLELKKGRHATGA